MKFIAIKAYASAPTSNPTALVEILLNIDSIIMIQKHEPNHTTPGDYWIIHNNGGFSVPKTEAAKILSAIGMR